MNILLIGECYSENIGDQAVSLSTKWLIENVSIQDVEFSVLDLSGRDSFSLEKKFYLKDSSFLTKLRNYLSSISLIDYLLKKNSAKRLDGYYKRIINQKDFDCAIFCGGQLINETFVCQMELVTSYLMKKNIPVIYSGIGIGRLNNWQIRIFNKLLNYSNVKGITCRCDVNRFNENLKLNSITIIETYDSAILISQCANIKKRRSDVIGLGVMKSSRFSDYTAKCFWVSVVKELENRNIKWKFFYTGTIGDYELALEIIKELGLLNKKEEYINYIITTPQELLTELSFFDRIISFRLHSHIFAYSLGIPSVAIKWDDKVSDFFNKIKRSDCVYNLGSETERIVDKILNCEYYNNLELELVKSEIKNKLNSLILENICKKS